METRELRYFVAVAEELHFGRAAQRLAMAQPPLSRAIQQLERRLGVLLFDRGSRAITLTDAGAVLLEEARVALDAVEAAGRLTRRAAVGRPTVVLAAKAGASRELLARILERYAANPAAVPVEVMLCGPGEPEVLLRNGTADVALLQRPYDSTAGWESLELFTEQQVLILPAGHPLSRDGLVAAADVASAVDLPMPRWPRSDGTYAEGPGPAVRDHTQLFQLVALGRACAWVPESAVPLARDDLAVLRVPDASAVTAVLAWRPYGPASCVAGFVGTARDMAPMPAGR